MTLILTPDLRADAVPVFRSRRPAQPAPIRPRPGGPLAAEVRRLRAAGVPPRKARPELPPITDELANSIRATAEALARATFGDKT